MPSPVRRSRVPQRRSIQPIEEYSLPDQPSDKKLWLQIARYSQLGLLLPAATFVGWLIGVGLDKWLHTTWLYLAGLLFGIVAGFVELIRTVMSSDESGE
jgi:F0F1-type ATP synthase assembly protein I